MKHLNLNMNPKVTTFPAYTNTSSQFSSHWRVGTSVNMTTDHHFTFFCGQHLERRPCLKILNLKIGCHKDVWGGAKFLHLKQFKAISYATSLYLHAKQAKSASCTGSCGPCTEANKQSKDLSNWTGVAWVSEMAQGGYLCINSVKLVRKDGNIM